MLCLSFMPLAVTLCFLGSKLDDCNKLLDLLMKPVGRNLSSRSVKSLILESSKLSLESSKDNSIIVSNFLFSF